MPPIFDGTIPAETHVLGPGNAGTRNAPVREG